MPDIAGSFAEANPLFRNTAPRQLEIVSVDKQRTMAAAGPVMKEPDNTAARYPSAAAQQHITGDSPGKQRGVCCRIDRGPVQSKNPFYNHYNSPVTPYTLFLRTTIKAARGPAVPHVTIPGNRSVQVLAETENKVNYVKTGGTPCSTAKPYGTGCLFSYGCR
jgi:hypothetical protein